MSDEKEECINKIVDNLYHHPVIMEFIISQLEKDEVNVKVFNDRSMIQKKWKMALMPIVVYSAIMLSTNFLNFIDSKLICFLSNVGIFFLFLGWVSVATTHASSEENERFKDIDVNFDVVSLKRLKKEIRPHEFRVFISIMKSEYFKEKIGSNIMKYINDESEEYNKKDLLGGFVRLLEVEDKEIITLNKKVSEKQKKDDFLNALAKEDARGLNEYN